MQTRDGVLERPAAAAAVRLRLEFLALFVAAPVAMAVFVPADRMFAILFLVSALGMLLLHLTPGFRWRDLWDGLGRMSWKAVLALAALTLGFGAAYLWLSQPEALFALVRHQPGLMVAIFLLYPLVSALPQELVYRALFFRRYAQILPRSPQAAIMANAALFSLAHLMYWSWVVLLMTFAAGIAFAWAYEVRRSFPLAVVLHAVGGNLVFLVGLGVHFYSGNAVRPF